MTSGGAGQMGQDTLFERLGGEAGVARLLDFHYERVTADEHLREYFLDVDLERLKISQLVFLAKLFGDVRYDAAALRGVHRDQLVSELAFDGFIDSLIGCAADLGASAADQAAIRDALKALRDSVITAFKPNPAYNYPTKPL
jgi:hemoglobin